MTWAREQGRTVPKGRTPAILGCCLGVLAFAARVPYTEVFSNQLLDDLDRILELRFLIPDPTDPSKCVVSVER